MVEQVQEDQKRILRDPLALYPGLTITTPTDVPIKLEGYPKLAFVYSLSENKRYKNILADKGASKYRFIK